MRAEAVGFGRNYYGSGVSFTMWSFRAYDAATDEPIPPQKLKVYVDLAPAGDGTRMYLQFVPKLADARDGNILRVSPSSFAVTAEGYEPCFWTELRARPLGAA
jgi:hypothetical protein